MSREGVVRVKKVNELIIKGEVCVLYVYINKVVYSIEE
jgi:hypothetical protein